MRWFLLWLRRTSCFHGDLVKSPDDWTAGYFICCDCGSAFAQDGSSRGYYSENPCLRNAKLLAGIEQKR